MRTAHFDEAAMAEAVTRTLHAVADATPIAPAPAIGEHAAVIPLRRLQSTAGHHRRWLAAAVAVAVLAIGVPIALDARRSDEPDATTAYEAPPALIPGAVPDGLSEAEPFDEVDLGGLTLEAAVMYPDGHLSDPDPDTPAILAARVTAAPGEKVTREQLDTLGRRLAAVFGGDGPVQVASLATGEERGAVAVLRGDAAVRDAEAVVSHLAAGAALEDSVPVPLDWNAFPLPLDWVPGVSPTSGVRYTDGDRSLEVTTADVALPPINVLGQMLHGVTPLPLTTGAGWRWTPPGSDHTLVVWRPSPGLVGTVDATGLPDDEVAQVIDSIVPPATFPETFDHEARVVARSEPGDHPAWAIEFARGTGFAQLSEADDQNCWEFVVEDEEWIQWGCGNSSSPTAPAQYLNAIAQDSDTTLVLGVFGQYVTALTTDDPTIGSVEVRPMVPSDPASLRYAVIAVPRGRSSVSVTMLAADGGPLATQVIDLTGEIPPQG